MTVLNDADAIYYRVGMLGGGAASRVYAGAVLAWPPVPKYADVILGTPGLVGFWRFDEPTSATKPFDATGNNNTNCWDRAETMAFAVPGAIAGSTAHDFGTNGLAVIEGPLSAALEDSLRPTPADYERLAAELAADPRAMRVLDLGDGPMTLEVWVNVSLGPPIAGYRCILSKGAGAYALWSNPDGRFAMHTSATGEIARSTSPIPATGWHHLVATKLGATAHIYVDGVDATTPIGVHAMRDNAGQWLFIASENSAGWPGSWWDNGIDEVAVYNLVLTPAQVLEHYNKGREVP